MSYGVNIAHIGAGNRPRRYTDKTLYTISHANIPNSSLFRPPSSNGHISKDYIIKRFYASQRNKRIHSNKAVNYERNKNGAVQIKKPKRILKKTLDVVGDVLLLPITLPINLSCELANSYSEAKRKQEEYIREKQKEHEKKQQFRDTSRWDTSDPETGQNVSYSVNDTVIEIGKTTINRPLSYFKEKCGAEKGYQLNSDSLTKTSQNRRRFNDPFKMSFDVRSSMEALEYLDLVAQEKYGEDGYKLKIKLAPAANLADVSSENGYNTKVTPCFLVDIKDTETGKTESIHVIDGKIHQYDVHNDALFNVSYENVRKVILEDVKENGISGTARKRALPKKVVKKVVRKNEIYQNDTGKAYNVLGNSAEILKKGIFSLKKAHEETGLSYSFLMNQRKMLKANDWNTDTVNRQLIMQDFLDEDIIDIAKYTFAIKNPDYDTFKRVSEYRFAKKALESESALETSAKILSGKGFFKKTRAKYKTGLSMNVIKEHQKLLKRMGDAGVANRALLGQMKYLEMAKHSNTEITDGLYYDVDWKTVKRSLEAHQKTSKNHDMLKIAAGQEIYKGMLNKFIISNADKSPDEIMKLLRRKNSNQSKDLNQAFRFYGIDTDFISDDTLGFSFLGQILGYRSIGGNAHQETKKALEADTCKQWLYENMSRRMQNKDVDERFMPFVVNNLGIQGGNNGKQ